MNDSLCWSPTHSSGIFRIMVDKCFLTIPTKSTEEVKFLQPVKLTLGTLYTKPSADNALFATKELEGLRRNAVGRILDRTTNSLEILCRYYDQLGSLESKIPAVTYKIPFKWANAFDKPGVFSSGKSIKEERSVQTSLAFEKMCVLFNSAALLSQIAANQNLATDEGLKDASRNFQQSAGTFQWVKDHIQSTIQQEPTPDLTQDALAALVALMLAQGQEVCFMKAVKEQMKDAVIAKVAAQTSDFYETAVKLLQKDSVKLIWDKDWLGIINCKQNGYLAIAEYHLSVGHKSSQEFGEELSRLKVATDAMNLAKKAFDTPSYPFKKIQGVIQAAYEAAKKDNDFIYHVVVPNHKNLEPIGRAPLVKPIPPTFPLSKSFIELFQPLIIGESSKCTIC